MQIRFNANLDAGECAISKASLRDLDNLDPLLAADILKDIVYDAEEAYKAALDRLHAHWAEIRKAAGHET